MTFNAIRVTSDPENISKTAEDRAIFPLPYCFMTKNDLFQKKSGIYLNHRAYGPQGDTSCVISFCYMISCWRYEDTLSRFTYKNSHA